MTASITLQSAITFHPYVMGEDDDPAIAAYWELYLRAVSSSNAPTKVFVVEVQRKRSGNSYVWMESSFVRVASKDDMATYPYEAPDEEDDSLKNGYYCYLTDSLYQKFLSWDEANASYTRTRGQVLSLLGVASTTEIAGELSLRVVGPALRRVPGVPNSMYPMDQATFVGVGGARPYTYSLDSDASGSTIGTATGVFTASCLGNTTVTVIVTDSAGSPAQANLLVTLVTPSSPPESEVLNV